LPGQSCACGETIVVGDRLDAAAQQSVEALDQVPHEQRNVLAALVSGGSVIGKTFSR
jgi:hypothetical protein